MKKKILTFLLLSLSLFISACECDEGINCGLPEKTFSYSGRIVDNSSAKTFSNRTITFRHKVNRQYPTRHVDKILGYATIDSLGYFKFEHSINAGNPSDRELYLELDTVLNDFKWLMPLPIYENWNREFYVSTLSGLVLHFSKPLAASEKLIWRYGNLYEIVGPRAAGLQPLIKIPNEDFSFNLYYGIDSINSVNPKSVPFKPSGDPNVDTLYLTF